MDGLGGYEGWRWIFLLEGIASVVAGALCFVLLLDLPSSAKWLTQDEARFLILTHASTRGIKSEEETKRRFSWSTLWQVLTDS